jgi:dTDP-4-amino-4,6-dideoxygalactose transaminase
VPVVEDCAQAWGASFNGRQVGSIGAMGAFSFFPSKNLGCFGDGGLVTTADSGFDRSLRELRVHGQSGPYQHPLVGGNFRIDALQAAILRVKLPHVGTWVEGRRANAERYRELFTNAGLDHMVGLPTSVAGRGHTFNQYMIRAPRRDELRTYLTDLGIGAAVYYPLREVMALPVFPELAGSELEEVVNAIEEFYAN